MTRRYESDPARPRAQRICLTIECDIWNCDTTAKFYGYRRGSMLLNSAVNAGWDDSVKSRCPECLKSNIKRWKIR